MAGNRTQITRSEGGHIDRLLDLVANNSGRIVGVVRTISTMKKASEILRDKNVVKPGGKSHLEKLISVREKTKKVKDGQSSLQL
jgi:hypothetical protein